MITASAPRRPNRTKRVLIALAVWLGVATLLFVWAGFQSATYRARFNEFASGVRSSLEGAPEHIKQAKDADDTTAISAALASLSATLSQKADHAPEIANVFGVQIGVDAEVRKQTAIVGTAKEASLTLKQTADFIDFQSKLARSLQSLSLKDASNYEQTIALANAWQETANTLQHATKPPQVTEVSATLLQKMIVVESRIRELAELYKQSDASGFAAKQKELATIIDEIKPLGAKITEISTSLDSQLQRTLSALRQNL
jgi:pterin-4a-carbinolamine dehydratase